MTYHWTLITATAYKQNVCIIGTESVRAYNRIMRLLLVLKIGVKCHWFSLILSGSARTTCL